MKASINVEFTDDELRKYAEDVGRRWILRFMHEATRHMKEVPPEVLRVVGQTFASAVAEAKPQTGPIPSAEQTDAEFNTANRRCMRVPVSLLYWEEGWLCHECSTYNGLLHMACRTCLHVRCDVVIPPPPHPSSPSVQ